MVDTACTSMVAGLSFIRNLGLKESDLVPIRTEIRAANKSEIKIIGAVIVEIKLNKPISDLLTKQVVYITTSVDRVFLNLEACIHLGLVLPAFPHQELNRRDSAV